MSGPSGSSILTMLQHGAPPDSEIRSQPSAWIPTTATDREAVREQVGRILSSTMFRNSKRFPAFIRYTVEHALTSADGLKERTIGHDVFGRDPGYDTAQDPVVRMTAAEVRKRLAQYYQLPEHAAETVVTYQSGSYVPEFFVPVSPVAADAPVTDDESLPQQPGHRRGRLRRASILLIAGAVATVLIAAAVARARSTASPGSIERFWASIVNGSSPVLLCIGDPSSGRSGAASGTEPTSDPGDMTVGEFLRANSVRYTDAVTLAILAGELRARAKPFRIRRTAVTELQDLRDGPVVLIGGFNNPWTLRLGEGLRFSLATDHNGSYIRDQDHPDSRAWQIGPVSRVKDVTQTYGLITRVQNPATGQSVVAVSGLVLGTRAAGECLIDEGCLNSAERLRTGDWEHRNAQIVVTTTVIGENSGAPRVVAAHLW